MGQLKRNCRRKKASSHCSWSIWRFEFAGKNIVAGISRVAEPVRLLHRLNSFWPRRQVLSLSCGLGWGVEILTRGPIRLLHGRASSYPISSPQGKKFQAAEPEQEGHSHALFKVNEGLMVTTFGQDCMKITVLAAGPTKLKNHLQKKDF